MPSCGIGTYMKSPAADGWMDLGRLTWVSFLLLFYYNYYITLDIALYSIVTMRPFTLRMDVTADRLVLYSGVHESDQNFVAQVGTKL